MARGAKSKSQHYQRKVELSEGGCLQERRDARTRFRHMASEHKGVWQEILAAEASLRDGEEGEPAMLRPPVLRAEHYLDLDET